MRRASLFGMVLVGLVALVGGSRTTFSRSACVTVPFDFHSLANLSKVKVHVGALIYVERIEPEKYETRVSGFPWVAAYSSNPKVLRRVSLCPRVGPLSLPSRLAAFRALHPGTATLLAPLTPAWLAARPGLRRGLHPYRSTVTVKD